MLTIGNPAFPQLAVEIDFANNPTSGTRTWTDVTSDVRALTYIRAGRSDPLQQTSTGTLSMLLDNTTGNYDPLNPAGTYYPNVKRMRWIRVRAQWAGVTYDRWRGLITSWAPDWPQSGKDATTAVNAADTLKVLSLYDLAGNDLPAQRTDQRVAQVCTLVGLPYTATTGQSTVVDTGTLNPQSYALAHLQQVEDTENGRLFADPGGTIVFQDRHYRQLHGVVAGTIGDQAGEIRYDQSPLTLDDSNLWNTVAVTPAGGTASTASDATSQASYYARAFSKQLLTSSQVEAFAAASYLVKLYRDPAPKLPALQVHPLRDPTIWPTVLAAQNSQHMLFRRRPLYGGTINVDGYIEQIAETIIPGQAWDVTMQLSAIVDQAMWTLGDATLSRLGNTTVIGY
jgi:hypothetical protein